MGSLKGSLAVNSLGIYMASSFATSSDGHGGTLITDSAQRSRPSMSIRVLGKGRRERTLPLWKTTAAALRAWLAVRGRVAAPELFVNARGEPLNRWGFAYLLKQHAVTATRAHPGLDKKRISPHVLRHTCAMIILQATQDIRKVSLWLGHATLTTTEIYTRGDPTEKLDAMESIVPPHLRRGAFQPSDKLIALLKRAS
jgi:site-specific recombinase XerD